MSVTAVYYAYTDDWKSTALVFPVSGFGGRHPLLASVIFEHGRKVWPDGCECVMPVAELRQHLADLQEDDDVTDRATPFQGRTVEGLLEEMEAKELEIGKPVTLLLEPDD